MDLTKYQHSDFADAHNIKNEMPPDMVARAAKFLLNLYTPLETLFTGNKINFHSGYRSQALNDALPGSSKTSDHMKANALDFDVQGFSNRQTYQLIRNSTLSYKQLILEGRGSSNWVHISFDTDVDSSNQKKIALELPNA